MPPKIIENYMPLDACARFEEHILANPSPTSWPQRKAHYIYGGGFSPAPVPDLVALIDIPSGYKLRQVMWNHYTGNFDLGYHDDGWDLITVVNITSYGTLTLKRYAEQNSDDTVVTGSDQAGDAVQWDWKDEQAGWLHGGRMQAGRISLVLRYNMQGGR